MTKQDIINMVNEFSELDDETLKKYVDDELWLSQDYWEGFASAIVGLELYLRRRLP